MFWEFSPFRASDAPRRPKTMVGCLPPGVVQCARTDSWATHSVRPARGARETLPRPRDPAGRRTRPTREGGRGSWRRQPRALGSQTRRRPTKRPPGAPLSSGRPHPQPPWGVLGPSRDPYEPSGKQATQPSFTGQQGPCGDPFGPTRAPATLRPLCQALGPPGKAQLPPSGASADT